MVIHLSKDLTDKMFGDEAILRYLKICEDDFRSGNRMALFEALVICSRFQAVIPEWAADAILAGEAAVRAGECEDFNELFGFALPNRRDRRREAQIKANTKNVLGMLLMHRCDKDGSLNAEYAFDKIAESTGLPRRVVQEIYRRSGRWVKKIPQGSPEALNHGFVHCELAWPRRHGRPIL
jgi:hypothetical protein